MLIFKNFKPYLKERLILVCLLWGSIASLAWFSSFITKFVDEKVKVTILPSLFAYADWRLVVLLAVGALLGAGVTSFIFSRVSWVADDAIRQIEITTKLWDEVSSASTHLSMAYLAAMVLDHSNVHEWPEFLLVVLYAVLGWLFYKGEEPKKSSVVSVTAPVTVPASAAAPALTGGTSTTPASMP